MAASITSWSRCARSGSAPGTSSRPTRWRARSRPRLTPSAKRVAGKPRPKTLLVFGREPGSLRNIYASAGRGFLHDMLTVAGGDDVLQDIDKESAQISTEMILARRPEVIIELNAANRLNDADLKAVLDPWSALSSVPAVRNKRVIILTGSGLTVPGPRVVERHRADGQGAAPVKILVSWSTGKDSAWMLHLLKQQHPDAVAGLLTTTNEAFDRVAMHAVRRELLEAQAAAAGLPLHVIPLPWPCSNEEYEKRMRAAVTGFVADGFTHVAFGDLFLEDVRRYREERLAGPASSPLFPIWKTKSTAAARAGHDRGWAAGAADLRRSAQARSHASPAAPSISRC